jgi:hypothetical protein
MPRGRTAGKKKDRTMSNLRKKIEDILSAITFAEAGEFESARELMTGKKKRVLLAIQPGLKEGKVMRYALNTCKRNNADLDILFVAPTRMTDKSLRPFFKEAKLEGVHCRTVRRKGRLTDAIIDYTNSERDILFVVVESLTGLDRGGNLHEGSLSRGWDNLRCPLVVISGAASA